MNGRLSDVSGPPLRSSDIKSLLGSEHLVQTPRIQEPKSRGSITSPPRSDIVPDYEGQVYKRSKAGSWKSRFFVRGSGKLLIYKFIRIGPPKHTIDLADVSATVLGLLENRFHAFLLVVRDISKTYGCTNREQCLQWARRLSSDAGASFTPMDEYTREFNEKEQTTVMLKPHSLPVQLQEGMTVLHNSAGWALATAGRWQSAQWVKTVLPLKITADEALELLTDRRTEWDPTLLSLRTLLQVGPTKIVLNRFHEFTAVLLTSITYEPPGTLYLLQDSVRHFVYAKKPVVFTDCFEIKQHPVLPRLTLLTRVTQLKLPWRLATTSQRTVHKYHDCLSGIKTHLKIKRFMKHLEMRPTAVHIKKSSFLDPDSAYRPRQTPFKPSQRSKQFPREEFFVYGKGGRYERDEESGGIILTDPELLAKQRNVLSFLIRSMGSNLLKGKSVMNVSLPVNIFCPESLLQRMCRMFGYAPEYLDKAANTADPLLRVKYVCTFVTTMIHLSVEQKKPFNPILGETLQGFIGECPVYAEQTCHHPPVGSFQYYGHGYVLEGSHEFVASTSTNSISARQRGFAWVKFTDGTKCYFSLPTAIIGGIMFGKRTLNQQGVLTVVDRDHMIVAEIFFNPDRKGTIASLFSKQVTLTDTIRGSIARMRASHPVFDKKRFAALFHDGMNPLKTSPDDIEAVLSEIEGCWLTHLQIDKELFWSIDSLRPWLLTEPEELLPSDSSLRSDLCRLAENDEEAAQVEKERLEVLQRQDRALRARYKRK